MVKYRPILCSSMIMCSGGRMDSLLRIGSPTPICISTISTSSYLTLPSLPNFSMLSFSTSVTLATSPSARDLLLCWLSASPSIHKAVPNVMPSGRALFPKQPSHKYPHLNTSTIFYLAPKSRWSNPYITWSQSHHFQIGWRVRKLPHSTCQSTTKKVNSRPSCTYS